MSVSEARLAAYYHHASNTPVRPTSAGCEHQRSRPCSQCMQPVAKRTAGRDDHEHLAMWAQSRPRSSKRAVPREAIARMHAMFACGQTTLGDQLTWADRSSTLVRSKR